MPALLAAAFLSGVLGSLHCVAMCGGFAAACARQRAGLPLWHVGRLASYTALGLLAGAFGRILPGPAWVPAVLASLFLLWFALSLAGIVRDLPMLPTRLQEFGRRALTTPSAPSQLLFGMVNGLLPCGLVYSALSVPVALGHPWQGAAVMLAFGVGTIPALTLTVAGLRRVVLTSLWRRRVLALLILVTGLWAIWVRARSSTDPMRHQHVSQDVVR